MVTIIVNLLTFGILFSSIISITSNNPIISIIFLITAFVNAAGYLILLGINFIGISYIVIYVGAIAVLFLFIILMINIKLTDILDTGYNFTKNLPLGLSIASLLLFIFFSKQVTMAGDNLTPSIDPLQDTSAVTEYFNYFGFGKTSIFQQLFKDTTMYTPENNIVLEWISPTQIEVLGQFLYTYASIFLIVLSFILLLAMLAIIIISKKNITNI